MDPVKGQTLPKKLKIFALQHNYDQNRLFSSSLQHILSYRFPLLHFTQIFEHKQFHAAKF